MDIKYYRENGVYKIVINEEKIDVQNAYQLQDFILKLIKGGQYNLFLDLKQVYYIDSSGLGALVFCLREARKNRGNIQLSNLSSHVNSMMFLTRLNNIFDIV